MHKEIRQADGCFAAGALVCVLSLLALLAGCGVAPALVEPLASGLSIVPAHSLAGHVHGGQQPVSGSSIQVYAVSASGDGAAATPLLAQPAQTDATGEFSFLLTCPSPGSLVYLVASGGNPGLPLGASNRALTLMTALGACGDLSGFPSLLVNERSTVAAVWSLAPWMKSFSAVGSGVGDEGQLALAFVQAGQLVDVASGASPGPGLPAGISVPAAEISSLANVLSTCVNSAGGVAGDGSPCGTLFAAVQPAGGAAATETIGAALQMAMNAGENVAAIFDLTPANSPFQPALSAAPSSWAIGLSPGLFQIYIDPSSGRRPIDPNIYGIVSYGLDPTFAAEIKVPNQRWGGDGTTRYNWMVDSSNAGFDFFFIGGNGEASPIPAASADAMIRTAEAAGGRALMTIPIIPYVNSSAANTCSFLVSVYGAQQQTDPYYHPHGDSCGNSIAADGAQLIDSNVAYNNIPNSTSLQSGWIQHMVQTFGAAAQGGVPFYQLDNEPGGWSNTHRDVEPNGAPYSLIASLGSQYAAAIKSVDSSAQIFGPSDFTLGGWIGSPGQQNNLLAGQYYLQQMAAYEQAHGGRVLDYFDEHYYFNFSDAASQLASTRTLWDPSYNGGTWVEEYFFYGPMQLIPRFRQWIAQYYPGTKLALSEYSIDSGNKQITDALAEADVLGIFGVQGLDLANMWSPPGPSDPIAYAFRLYRDYDGQGGKFGETGIQASSADQTKLAVYGAQRTSDAAVTLVVLNKTTQVISASLALANVVPTAPVAVYGYSAANLTQIVSQSSISAGRNSFSLAFPPYSATVLILRTK